MNSALLSSKDMGWLTPENVLAPIRRFGGGQVELDPCTTAANPVGATLFMTTNALSYDWQLLAKDGLIYSNPPYGRQLKDWTAKFRMEGHVRGAELITLTPARTDTKWWHQDMITANRICFWKGRIKFIGPDGPMDACPFPCALSYWGKRSEDFSRHFKSYGWIVTP